MSKFTVRKLACAVAMVGASASAGAAITDLGTLSVGATAFGGFVEPGLTPVLDLFTFTLPASGGSDYSVVNFPLTIPAGTFNMIFTGMALVDPGANGVPGGGDDVSLASALGPDATLSVTLGPTATPQKLYVAVVGLADGTLGGIYNGAISVTPVPEPEAWAMMLVGAGLVGFRLRNRSKKAAANRFA